MATKARGRFSSADLAGMHYRLLDNVFRLRCADARQIEALLYPGRRSSDLRNALKDLKEGGFVQSAQYQTDCPGENNTIVRKKLSLYNITKKGSRAITNTSLTDQQSYVDAEDPTGRGSKEPERVRALPTSFNASLHAFGSVSALISLRHELHTRFAHLDGFNTVFDTEVQIQPFVRIEGKPVAITPENAKALLRTDPREWIDFPGIPNLADRPIGGIGSYGWSTLPFIQPDAIIVARWQGDKGIRRHVFLIEYTRTQKPSTLTDKFGKYELFLALWATSALRAAVTVLFVCDYPKEAQRSEPDHLPYDYAVAANAAMKGRVLDPSAQWPRDTIGAPLEVEWARKFIADNTIRSGREHLRFLPPHAMTLVAEEHAEHLKRRGQDKSATYAPGGGDGHVYALPDRPGTGLPYQASIFSREPADTANQSTLGY